MTNHEKYAKHAVSSANTLDIASELSPSGLISIFATLAVFFQTKLSKARFGKTRYAIANWVIVATAVFLAAIAILLYYLLVVAPSAPRY